MTKQENDVPVFDITLVSDEMTEEAKQILDMFRDKTAIISEYLPIKRYDEMIQTFTVNMTYGFEHKEFRDFPICFKFRNDDDEEAKWLPYRSFIINMIMWRPQICIDPDNLNDNLIISPALSSKIGVGMIKDYFDNNYVRKYNRGFPNNPYIKLENIRGDLSEILGETTFILQQTVGLFSNFFGISSSIETFKELADRIPEFKDLMYYKLDESKQPSEMEKDLNDAMNNAIDIIIKDNRWNPLKPLMATKSGLNMKQFRDMAINEGLKPDFEGRTIPRPVNTNFLAGGGFRDIVDLYTNGIAGRKAAIINSEFMGKTGHLLILIAISTASVRLSKTCMDCNTVNPIPIEIKSKTHLIKMDGRRYRHRGERVYSILNAKEQEDLIGETLEFRSPITCSCKDGVCRECYGELYYTNIDNEVTGIYSATTVMNPVVQGILSAKHHQDTNTSPIEFNNELFDKFFSISSTDIILNVDESMDITDYALVIRQEEIKLTDDEDVDLDFEKKRGRRKKANKDEDDEYSMETEASLEMTMKYYVTKFQLVKNLHTKGKTPEYYDFEDMDNKELFMHNDFITKMTADSDEFGKYLYMELEDINPDEFIFLVDVTNNELTKPMKEIQKVLNSKAHEGCNSYEEMVNKMLDLMIASKLDAMNIHAEMIIRELVRRKNNILRRPDFSKIVMSKDVELMTINSALKKNPSITTSLSTPYLKDQLINLTETFAKTAPSVFDPLFKPCLATDEDLERAHYIESNSNKHSVIEL